MDETHKKGHFHYALGTDEFKERCLELMGEIAERGGSVIIFDGDDPAVELVRYVEPPMPGYGSLKGKVQILDDIEGPMPVEWYTHPDVQTDDDWDISGPMPASWFVSPDAGKPKQRREPDKVDVSILHRHKFLTVSISEFTAQLDEIIAAVSKSNDGEVAVFDDGRGLVQLKQYAVTPSNSRRLVPEEGGS